MFFFQQLGAQFSAADSLLRCVLTHAPGFLIFVTARDVIKHQMFGWRLGDSFVTNTEQGKNDARMALECVSSSMGVFR